MKIENTLQPLYAFSLGREWKLSLAELIAVFGAENYQEHSGIIAIFKIHGWSDEQLAQRFLSIGGSIRVMKIIGETDPTRFPTDVITHIKSKRKNDGGKVTFALWSYGVDYALSNIWLRVKKTLQEKGFSVRLVNTENKNIVSAVFKREKLWKSQTEYNLISLSPSESESKGEDHPIYYLAISLACQDIDAYARRDTGKSRNMIVGMMPPKLVQMMINLAVTDPNHQRSKDQIQLYDPFCGLGTTLIEAANMGITHVYGSDLSREMVTATRESLDTFIKEELVWQERIIAVWGTPNKDLSKFESDIIVLDAKKIREAPLKFGALDFEHWTCHIVSEGFLWEMMNPRDISLDRVQGERKKLAAMYGDFFAWLRNAKFRGSIVMSFPFWNIRDVYSYFTEIYDIIEKNEFKVVPLLPGDMRLNTRQWSLLYRRENQTVGREIIKIIPR